MSTQNVTTVQSKGDVLLVTLAVLVALAGVFAFALLTEQQTIVRVGILGAGLVAALALGWFSASGKRFLVYCREAYEECRRVVWPTRKETINTTGIVFAFVCVIAFFLFVVDKIIEWVLYDLLMSLI